MQIDELAANRQLVPLPVQLESAPQNAEDVGMDGTQNSQPVPEYINRFIYCQRDPCQGKFGTQSAHMQLWTSDGKRGVTCSGCHRIQRVEPWHCEHGILWHQCVVHRIDPLIHTTHRKGKSARVNANSETPELLDIERVEPAAKRNCLGRIANAKRKSDALGQTAEFEFFDLDRNSCPKLARKFPERFVQCKVPRGTVLPPSGGFGSHRGALHER